MCPTVWQTKKHFCPHAAYSEKINLGGVIRFLKPEYVSLVSNINWIPLCFTATVTPCTEAKDKSTKRKWEGNGSWFETFSLHHSQLSIIEPAIPEARPCRLPRAHPFLTSALCPPRGHSPTSEVHIWRFLFTVSSLNVWFAASAALAFSFLCLGAWGSLLAFLLILRKLCTWPEKLIK